MYYIQKPQPGTIHYNIAEYFFYCSAGLLNSVVVYRILSEDTTISAMPGNIGLLCSKIVR